jgi:hypothetical protein
MFWDAAGDRSPVQQSVAWSIYAAGVWALGFGLFESGHDKAWGLAAPVTGPVFVILGYANYQWNRFVRDVAYPRTAYQQNSPSRIADGD